MCAESGGANDLLGMTRPVDEGPRRCGVLASGSSLPVTVARPRRSLTGFPAPYAAGRAAGYLAPTGRREASRSGRVPPMTARADLAIRPLDQAATAAARERQSQLVKPPGSLGRLEELAVWLAGVTGNARPQVRARDRRRRRRPWRRGRGRQRLPGRGDRPDARDVPLRRRRRLGARLAAWTPSSCASTPASRPTPRASTSSAPACRRAPTSRERPRSSATTSCTRSTSAASSRRTPRAQASPSSRAARWASATRRPPRAWPAG